MLPLSLCLIAKNEEKKLNHSLLSLTPLTKAGAELIITDTGSSDGTKEIAGHYTDRIYDFPWCDDFSAARNFCASKASNDWILFLDCDESLHHSPPAAAVDLLLCFIREVPPDHVGQILLKSPTSSGSITTDTLARLYHRDYYTYKGVIHEQLFPLHKNRPLYQKTGLEFWHSGYEDASVFQEKARRNLRLLQKAYASDPSDTYTLFQIGQSYRSLQQYDKALDYFEQALAKDMDPDLDYVRTLVESYGYTLLDLGMAKKALELQGVYDTFCTRADFVFLMGMICMNNGRFEDAIRQFRQATLIPCHSVEGVNSYLAYYNIGVIYECSGHTSDALHYYRKCGDYAPALERILALCTHG